MTKFKFYCVNGFPTKTTGKAVTPAVKISPNWPAACTSACCLTMIGGRMHRCGFLAQVKAKGAF